jgi:single-stranded-DNA-specific exonuclease
LEALAKQLRLEMPQAHRSMGDCLATAALFQRIEEYADPRLSFFIEDQLDLVCLGTIADVVPLIGENRTVVKHGLPYLLKTRKIGLQKLLEASALKISQKNTNTQPTAKEIGWNVTPILNAAGRFSKANLTVQLLLTKEPYEANTLVHQLMQLNQDRRHLQKTNIEKFLDLAKTQCDLERDRLIFVVAEALGHGVTGIAANQLMREFGRPVVLLIRDEKEISGSSRSIPGFNIVEAFDECKDLLIRYGGHPAAAGLSVAPDKIECLRKKLKEIAERKITPKFLAPQIIIDMNLPFDVITNEFIQEISQLEPFGEGNPPPLFTLKSAQVEEHSVMGPNKNHLRLKLSNQTKLLSGVGWGMSSSVPTLKKGDLVDLVFYLERDTWNDLSPKLVLQDLQVAKPSQIYSHLN